MPNLVTPTHTLGGPGSGERHAGLYSAERVKSFTVTTGGTTRNTSFTTNTGVGTFLVGETITGASKSGIIKSVSGTAPTMTLVVEPVIGVFANGNAITGGTSGATAVIDVATPLSIPATFASDRCICGATAINLTWDGAWRTLSRDTLTGAQWRHEKLPFPCTPCVTISTLDLIAGSVLELKIHGVGQFGEPIVETLPRFTFLDPVLYQAIANRIYVNKLWASRVFSKVTAIEYRGTGNVPASATLMAGQFFTWDESLPGIVGAPKISTFDTVGITFGTYYFSFNQGIGTQIRLAGDYGRAFRRYPEVENFTVRRPTGGIGGTQQVLPVGDLANQAAGFYMGSSPATDMLDNGVCPLSGIRVTDFDGDGNKIRLACLTELVDGTGSVGRLVYWDGTTDDTYYRSEGLKTPPWTGGVGRIDNPKSLIYDFTFRTQLGVKTNKLQYSSFPNT